MAVDLTRWRADGPLRAIVLTAGVHSCVLGVAMLAAPRLVLAAFRFPPPENVFFPSQSGIFLVIMGLCYLRALKVPSFVRTILLSKSLAVLFLLAHLLFLAGPPILWAALAVDGGFLAATLARLGRHGGVAALLDEGGPDIRLRAGEASGETVRLRAAGH